MKQTSLRGIVNKAASDKAHWLQNLFGMLPVGFLLWGWQFVNKRAANGVDGQDALPAYLSAGMRTIVCHEGAQQDGVLRAAVLHK